MKSNIEWVWDDDPEDMFGQVWLPCCPNCHAGPQNFGAKHCNNCGKELIWGSKDSWKVKY